jgi:hypothetical protein
MKMEIDQRKRWHWAWACHPPRIAIAADVFDATEFYLIFLSNAISLWQYIYQRHGKVGKDAGEKEIKRAYRKLAMMHHPNKGGEDDHRFRPIISRVFSPDLAPDLAPDLRR